MRTSTKILILLSIFTVVPSVFLAKYLISAIVPTGDGFEFNFGTLSWVSLAFMVASNILLAVLFFRFIRVQKLSNAIFFSVFPVTLFYGVFMAYIVGVKDMPGVVAESVRVTMNISTDTVSYNNYLWAGISTLVYLVLLFSIVMFACKPLSKVERITEKLGDGRVKQDSIKVGGGKQFKSIEDSLNKINYTFKENENRLKQINIELQKALPKYFLKFLGKKNVAELEMGRQIKKEVAVLCCDFKSDAIKTLSAEGNFNKMNLYLKSISPLLKKHCGYIDKYTNAGILAVFCTSQDAIECGHAILKTFNLKDKSAVEPKICVHTGEFVFGVVDEDGVKKTTIVSGTDLLEKMQDINLFMGTKFLITKKVLGALPQNFEFDYRYTGVLQLSDDFHLALYESLVCYPRGIRSKLKKYKNQFETGVRTFNLKNYDRAKIIFQEMLKDFPEDKVAFVYFNKSCEKLKEVA